jgi:tetratricopeptide (TPR) repeat protein
MDKSPKKMASFLNLFKPMVYLAVEFYNVMRFFFYIIGLFIAVFSTVCGYSQSNTNANNSFNSSSPPTMNEDVLKSAEDDRSERTNQLSLRDQYFFKKSEFQSKDSKHISTAEQHQLDLIVNQVQKTAKNSYEYHYLSYINSNHSSSAFHHLQEAYKINPNATELYKEFVSYYEISNNKEAKKDFLNKIKTTAQYSEEQYVFAYNLLASCSDEKAVLFTYGNIDTYPVWVQQEINGKFPNVKVLNLELLLVEDYYKQLSSKYKLPKLNPVSQTTQYIKEFARNNSSVSVYVASTVSPTTLKELNASLYSTGLVFKYSPQPIQNAPILIKNWETNFNTKTLAKTALGEDAKLKTNYLVAITLVQDKYRQQGKTKEADKLLELAKKIAKEAGVEEKYNAILKAYGQ